ncbi:hypothetical protein D3C81_1674660 [compost metagenome]
MVLALADRLAVPLRQRNRLLLASGFAPAYSEHALAAPPLHMVRQAIALILSKQEPYPAVVLDRFWNLVDANVAYRRMFGTLLAGRQPVSLDEDGRRINLMLTVFDPDGLWPMIENAQQVGRYLVRRVWQALQAQAHDEAGRFRASLFSTLTTLGIPQDVTLEELRIECFFPADEATRAVFESLAGTPAPASALES